MGKKHFTLFSLLWLGMVPGPAWASNGVSCQVMSDVVNSYSGSVACPPGMEPESGTCGYEPACFPTSLPFTGNPGGWQCGCGTVDPQQPMLSITVNCCPKAPVMNGTATTTAPASSTAITTNTTIGTMPDRTPEKPAPSSPSTTNSSSSHTSNAFGESASLYGETASQMIAINVTRCAWGASRALSDEDAAAAALGHCISGIGNARDIQRLGEETAKRDGKILAALNPSDSLLNGDGAKKIFADFEKKFGESGEDFARRMIETGASRESLEEVLKKKLKAEQMKKILDAAEEAAKEKPKNVISLLGAGAKGKQGPTLRASLAANMEAKSEGASSSKIIARVDKKRVPIKGEELLDSLTPIDDPLFQSKQDSHEITIFDVVRAKYREKWPLLMRERQKR